jgi:hypothetical protein
MVLIWGINFPIAKAALDELTPLAFNALRFPLAALTSWPRCACDRPLSAGPLPATASAIIGLGMLGNVFYQQFFIFGLDNTRAGTCQRPAGRNAHPDGALLSARHRDTNGSRPGRGSASRHIRGHRAVVLLAPPGDHATGEPACWATPSCWARPWPGRPTRGQPQPGHRYGALQFTAWTLGWAPWLCSPLACPTCCAPTSPP